MREVRVTDKNRHRFTMSDTYSGDVLKVIDELLHSKGLEIVMGEDGSSDYAIAIVPTQEDGEYDEENTHNIMYPKRKLFERAPIKPGDDAIFVGP